MSGFIKPVYHPTSRNVPIEAVADIRNGSVGPFYRTSIQTNISAVVPLHPAKTRLFRLIRYHGVFRRSGGRRRGRRRDKGTRREFAEGAMIAK